MSADQGAGGPLSAGPGQVAAFEAYLARFNASDIEGFTGYYTDDVVFDLGVAPPFRSKSEVIAFYRRTFSALRETVTVDSLDAGPDAISANISVVFTAFADAADFVLGPLAPGQSITARFHVGYTLRDGWVHAVKIAMTAPPTPA